MMLSIALAMVMQASALANEPWYGGEAVRFDIEFAGDPYDPAQNDVVVKFTGPNGFIETRRAFFDGSSWISVLWSHEKGRFKPALWRNGQEITPLAPQPEFCDLVDHKEPELFYKGQDRARPLQKDGLPFFPFISSLAPASVHSTLFEAVRDELPTRVFRLSSSAIGSPHNPFWLGAQDRGALNEAACENWVNDLSLAQQSHLWVEPVALTASDFLAPAPTWPQKTRDSLNISKPNDIFTSPQAKEREKRWLGWLVDWANTSHQVFAIDLADVPDFQHFTEADVTAWCQEMAKFVHERAQIPLLVSATLPLAPAQSIPGLDLVQLSTTNLSQPPTMPWIPVSLQIGLDSAAQLGEAVIHALEFGSEGLPATMKEGDTWLRALSELHLGDGPRPMKYQCKNQAGEAIGHGLATPDSLIAVVSLTQGGKLDLSLTGFAKGDYNATIWTDEMAAPIEANITANHAEIQVGHKPGRVFIIAKRK